MGLVSFQIIDGVDKGRVFEGLDTPVTVGREEGNVIRLNDERVSRFHAKIQEDQGQIVLTDLDSTNGTCVNGEPIQLRLLRAGDQITMGRSKLLFGTPQEIATSLREAEPTAQPATPNALTIMNGASGAMMTQMLEVDPEFRADVFEQQAPKLPARLTPAQAAQLSEAIDFLHRSLSDAIDAVHVPAAGEARLPIASWQKVQAVLGVLSRYSRAIAEPSAAENVPAH
ncbi:MAG TPA: FHA domain-containing protein [Planctomycetia bacterium]|jgi:predicted component of type VI protein secretion system|nr:FHA domain-containing protein [Planctomycetia bacterium]